MEKKKDEIYYTQYMELDILIRKIGIEPAFIYKKISFSDFAVIFQISYWDW